MNPHIDVNEMVKEVMNDIEHDKLIAFTSDQVMYNAVKKFILWSAYHDGVMEKGKPFDSGRNWALQTAFLAINPTNIPRSNEEIGADLRAWVKGLNMVESGFKELLDLKRDEKPVEEEKNPAL